MRYRDLLRITEFPVAEITLTPCPKTYIRETHRSRSPDETHAFVQGMAQAVGMEHVREVTDLDRIGIPVYTCSRMRPDGTTTDHTGKGLSAVQAQVSLTMEAVERYSAEYDENAYAGDVVRGSFRDLEKMSPILNPEELILPQFSSYQHNMTMHWVWGFDLVSRSKLLVPACAVFHPFHLDDTPVLSTHTNGLASGNTMEEAVSHAIEEVIERDAWSINRFTAYASDALFVDDREEYRCIVDVSSKFVNAGIEVVAKDITSDIGVPVVAAFSNDGVYRSMITIDGFGAHLDPKVAMIRALLELATTRGLFIQKKGIESFREEYLSGAVIDEFEGDYRFCAYRQKSLAELGEGYSDDILGDIQMMQSKLTVKGFDRIIAVDLTRQDVGIPTVRVLIPGMEVYCFDTARIGKRLLDAL